MDIATASELNPHVVEKDYVLGWILWGIYGKESLSNNWVFKGGTCLKKCFFETYRFSEDLDFTLRDLQQTILDLEISKFDAIFSCSHH
jgi:predicted nucleotidyltransferase component of viral defense system